MLLPQTGPLFTEIIIINAIVLTFSRQRMTKIFRRTAGDSDRSVMRPATPATPTGDLEQVCTDYTVYITYLCVYCHDDPLPIKPALLLHAAAAAAAAAVARQQVHTKDPSVGTGSGCSGRTAQFPFQILFLEPHDAGCSGKRCVLNSALLYSTVVMILSIARMYTYIHVKVYIV